ncbi:MAG: hypothetical protein ACI4SF_02965 [Oscillospiraceae bacterium]
MDKKIHLADTSERIRKKYRVKEISVKQQKYKKNQDNHSYSAAPQKSSAEKAKQSENYSTYHNAHKKNTVKNDEARSHYSEDDNSAEKEKYRKQMQYTAYQQKAAEISEKLSSDIQENIEMSKRQASISSYESETPSKKQQYDDKTKEAAAMLASRIAGDVLRKTHITENNDSQTKSGTASKSQRVTFYLNSNQIEKARLTKPNSEARKRFNKAAENTYKERKKLDVAIDKENCKLKKYQKEAKKLEKQASKHYTSAFEKAENILYLEGKISSAANKGSTGESAAALSSTAAEIALKKVVEKAAQKHKSIGEMSRAAGAVAELSSSIDNENSIGSATASSVTAVPKYYIAQKAADTVKKTSEKHYKDKLEKKREALRQKQKAAEHRIEELKKEQAKRQQKINIYKSENGITSKNNTTLQNVKAVIKSQQNAAKAAAVAKSSATVIAAAGGAIIPIICIIVVIIIIIVLFSWLKPHEETFYNEADNTWEPIMVETNEEILKGYIKHIQDYFDKKQLEILKRIEFEFGGFEPDCYEWEHTEENPNAIAEDPDKMIQAEYRGYYISVKKSEYTITGMTEGGPGVTQKPVWSTEPTITTYCHADAKTSKGTWDESYRVMHDEYYKIDEVGGYERRTTSDDYDYIATYLDYSIDVAEFWNSIEKIKKEKDIGKNGITGYEEDVVYKAEIISGDVITDKTEVLDRGILGKVGRDITGYTLRLYRNSDKIYDGDYVAYLKSHPELFMHIEGVPLVEYYSLFSSKDKLDIANGIARPASYEVSYVTRNRTEIMEDLQYVPDKHIWNLNEYGNRWIKLSDDCDFEHIIAMAAIKKWQEIASDGFDSNTYTFEITDDDLDYCLDNLYNFYFSYTSGQCQYANCAKKDDKTYCNRPTTHKHLIGQVTNLEIAGGIDYVLNRVLKIPVPSNYSSEKEYQRALANFETCKDIYEVYVEYIYNELGTSTKISDYENDNAAQYRLLKMYQAENGKKPSNPPQNIKVISHKKQAAPITPSEAATCPGATKYEHYYISLKWDAPEPEYISEDKTVEITQYDIYELDRSSGKKTKLATVSADNLAAYDIDVGSGPYKEKDGDTVRVKERQITIVMQSVNEAGSSPNSKHVTYWLN